MEQSSSSDAEHPELLTRVSSPELDSILGKPFPLLDKGFVRLVNYLGNESSIVQAARVSYGKGTKRVREDAALIDYLFRNLHTSPFEQLSLTIHCKMPIFVARQWVRHRTARLNEKSGRYSILTDEFYVPEADRIQIQSGDNKQGSDESFKLDSKVQQEVIDVLVEGQRRAYEEYEGFLHLGEDEDGNKFGVARELARINLPLSLYTEWYWNIDLHNLLHFLRLRLDSHAQYEVRVYAEAIYENMVKPWVPAVVGAFENYVLHSVTLSSKQMELIEKMRLRITSPEIFNPAALGVVAKDIGLSRSEFKDFVKKFLARMVKESDLE